MTTNQSFFVKATNAAASTNDIRALKPPVEIPNFWFWVFVIAGIIAVLAMIVIGLIVWLASRNQAEKLVPAAPIPPHERARQKLQEALALFSQPRPFCILVSDTIRQYLEERFNFRAPERTTEEFLHELAKSDLLLPDQKQSLGEFLYVCDMVKFARYEPGEPELQALHESAVRLIDETEPQPEPAQPAPTSA
jgi:hypothetical protein